MIPVVHIELEKAEGCAQSLPKRVLAIEEDGPDLWKLADKILRAWAWDMVASYDKTDFTVTFEDGKNYRGTIDLANPRNGRTERLADHIREFCLTYSGRQCPDHITYEQYHEYLQSYKTEDLAEYGQFLDNYQLG